MIRMSPIVLLMLAVAPVVAADSRPLSDQYGFKEPEIYKLDYRISNLIARDVNGDGKLDLACINNLRNRIDVLEQRSPGDKPKQSKTSSDVNEITNDQRLEHRKIQVRRGINSLEIKDVNSDGRADLVYLGDPKGLYIEYQQPDGTFGHDRIFENSDAQSSSWTVDVGDLNSDGKNDIAYLGQRYLYIIYQLDEGRLSEPKRFRLGDDQAGLLKIVDLNADGRNDLVYFAQSADLPIRIRLQQEDKSFGPERRLKIDPPRGVSFTDFDGKPGEEVLSISSLNDRLMVYGFDTAKPTDDLPTGQAVVFPFDAAGTGKSADVVIADFDGDGQLDVIASDADSSQFQFFRNAQTMTTFPCLLGTESLRAVDVDGDKTSALLSLSSKDKSLAISEFKNGRLTFPQPLPTLGDVAVFEVTGKGDESRILYVAKENREIDGKKKDVYVLRQLAPTEAKEDGTWMVDSIAGKPEIEIKLDNRPNDLRIADVNGDGRLDLIAFIPFKPPAILIAKEDGSFETAPDTSKGTLGNLSPADVFYGTIGDGKQAFLVTQENFARRLQMDADGRWNVLDQYNAATGSAKVRGVTAIDLVGDSTAELVMYDRASQSLIFLREEDGIYRAWQSLKVGGFDIRGMRTADLNGDGSDDLLLFDGVKMAIVYSRSEDLVLKVLATYESSNKETQLFDMVPGDLNGDHKLDILLLDPMDHNLEIVTRDDDNKIEKALGWQVFEEKTFQRLSGSLEPREAVIADVDGDGLNDIVLLVHDRVLIYLQDDGRGEPATAAK